MFTGRTPEEYQRALFSLQPRGFLWNRDPDSYWGLLVLGMAQEFSRIDQRVYDLIKESIYAYTDELLEEYEYDFGLPDPGYETPSTDEERRNLIKAKAIQIGRMDAGYYDGIGNELDYDITIVQHQPAWAGYFEAGNPCGQQQNIFFFHAYIDYSHSMTIEKRLGSLMFQIDRQKPGHMIALYDWYGIDFSRGFDNSFDSSVYNDNQFLPGSFGREFDSSFRNAYDYDGDHLVGAFTASFNLSFDAYNGGAFYADNFSTAFRRP